MNKIIQNFKRDEAKTGKELARINEQIAKLNKAMEEKKEAVNVKRVSIADEIIAETLKALTEIGCEDRLNCGAVKYITKEVEIVKEVPVKDETRIKELTTQIINLKAELTKIKKTPKTIEIIKEVPGPVQIVRDMEEADKWIERYRNLEKQMKELKANLESEKKAKETWQSKYSKLKNKYDALLAADKEADELFAPTELPAETIESSLTDEDVAQMDANAYYNNLETEKDIVNTDKLVELKSYKNERREGVKFYSNKNYRVMVGENCQEITVIPVSNGLTVTTEIVEQIQIELLEFGYRKQREVVSPAVIYMNKGHVQGYFARTNAGVSRLKFSKEDFYGGYVMGTDNIAYLWSWDGKSEKCAVYKLDKVIVGDKENKYVSDRIIKFVSKEVKEMYADYLKKANTVQKEQEEVVSKNTQALKEKKDARKTHNDKFKKAAERKAARLAAKNNNNEEVKNDTNVATNEGKSTISRETQEHLDTF
ncbi:MAG: hypothetical protein ACRCX8_10275 [Sarcina sp.]